jgi:excisionase family DNA binding protein
VRERGVLGKPPAPSMRIATLMESLAHRKQTKNISHVSWEAGGQLWAVAEVLLGTKEVAQRLGRTQARVRQLIDEGKLPGQRLGRDWYVRESDVEKYIEKNRQAGMFDVDPDA